MLYVEQENIPEIIGRVHYGVIYFFLSYLNFEIPMRHSSRIINIANKTSLAVLTLKPKKENLGFYWSRAHDHCDIGEVPY